jgi:hypothetical protein
MVNGFYDTSEITKSKRSMTLFFKYVMMLSHTMTVETKYNKDNVHYSHREHNRRYTPERIIDIGGTLDVIDRNIYNQGQIKDAEGEICLHTNNWEMLYCFLTLDNLQNVITKYNLKLKEW